MRTSYRIKEFGSRKVKLLFTECCNSLIGILRMEILPISVYDSPGKSYEEKLDSQDHRLIPRTTIASY